MTTYAQEAVSAGTGYIPPAGLHTGHRGMYHNGTNYIVADDAQLLTASPPNYPNGNLVSLTIPASFAVPSNWLGMHAHRYPGGGSAFPSVPYATVRSHDYQVGGKSLRWHHINPSNGTWDWALFDQWVNEWYGRGSDLIYTLGFTPAWCAGTPQSYAVGKEAYGTNTSAAPNDMQKWADYCSAVATRYNGKIKYYEVWNEPHFATGYSTYFYADTAAKLAEMTRIASLVIKAIDPTAKIISAPISKTDATGQGELASYLDASAAGLSVGGNTGAAQTAANYVDVLGVHTYEPDINYGKTIFANMAAIRAIRDARPCSGVQIWNTECGYLTADKVPAAVKQERIVRLLAAAACSGASRVLFYSWDNGIMGVASESAAASEISALAQKLGGKTISFVNCERGGRLGIKMTNGDGYIF